MRRSNNCRRYEDNLTVYATAEAFVEGDECRVPVDVFSCQKDNFEYPDEDTLESLKEQGRKQLEEKGCSVDKSVELENIKTNQMGSHKDKSGKDLLNNGMASNCMLGDNKVDHVAEAYCNNYGTMKDREGNEVKNYNMQVRVRLGTCDVSLEANKQLEEDLKKAGKELFLEKGYLAEMKDISCNSYIFPAV